MKEPEKKTHSLTQLICFRLGREEFGIDILKVREIVPLQAITHLPQTPDTVAGVINLRGEIVPVINLRLKFGIKQINLNEQMRIIVVSIADKLVGILVDRVERVVRMREDQFELPPDIGVGRIQDYVISIGKLEESLIILLDIEKILTEEEILKIEDILKMKESLLKQNESEPEEETSGVNKGKAADSKETKTKSSRKRTDSSLPPRT